MKLSLNALRALNEYRRDSLLTYLMLRHTLKTTAGTTTRWAEEIAPELVLRQRGATYIRQDQFKSFDAGKFVYRETYYPGPNHALAESALLAACSARGGAFRPRPGVYSYHLASPDFIDGFFTRYFELFRKRQVAIARRCRRQPTHVVVFADIRNFYPSVSRRRALSAWREACDAANLEGRWRILGERILRSYADLGQSGLIVGPRFSHLLADLVLRDIDRSFRKRYRGAYYRYVDDFAFVVPEANVHEVKRSLRSALRPLGLKVHPKKVHELRAREWTRKSTHEEEEQMEHEGSRKWMAFVDSLKAFLVTRADQHEILRQQFFGSEIRLPLPRYRNQIVETTYVGRFANRLKRPWFFRRTSRASVDGLLRKAKRLREFYMTEFRDAWFEYNDADGILKKWALTRVKFVLGKLVMLASHAQLKDIAEFLKSDDQFADKRAVINAIRSGDVSEMLYYGATVCGPAGELITGTNRKYRCVPDRWSRPVIDGYIALVLRGVHLSPEPPLHVRCRWNLRVVLGRCAQTDWSRMDTAFLREFAALAGGSSLEAHRDLLSAPLDPGEPISAAELVDGITS